LAFSGHPLYYSLYTSPNWALKFYADSKIMVPSLYEGRETPEIEVKVIGPERSKSPSAGREREWL